MLYFYSTYIVEEWDIFKPFGKVIIYPFWAIRSLIMLIISPLFIFEYLIINSKYYKNFQIEINELLN